jgi:serine/threonine protein kinase
MIQLHKPSIIEITIGFIVSKTIYTFFPKSNTLDNTVGKYRLVEKISKQNSYQEYMLGKYTDGEKLYFVKTWQGKLKDYSYYALLNEYYITRVLFSALSRRRTDERLYVPEVKDVIVTSGSVSLVFEFVSGYSLTTLTVEEQKQHISFALKELNDLNKRLNAQERNVLIPYYRTFYVLVLPVYALIALIRQTKLFKSILRTLILSYQALLHQDNKKLFIAHRDITLDNLLVSGEKLYLLDCERMVLTFPLYDYENTTLDLDFSISAPRLRTNIDSFFKYFIPLQMVAIETEIDAFNSYAHRLESL